MKKNVYRPNGKDYLHVNDNRVLKIDREYIEYLKSLADGHRDGKCMMCLHNDIREHVHEMINVYPAGTYVRPHNHPFKTETKIVIDGKLLMVVFDNSGEIIDEFIMERSGIFTFRLDKGIFHTNIPLTDAVFHEITDGPFVGKDDSVFPEWAPALDDEDGIRVIMDKINQKCKELKL